MPNYRVQNGQITRDKKDGFEVASGDLRIKAATSAAPGSWSAQIKLKAKSGMERLVGYAGELTCSFTTDDSVRWSGKASVGKVYPENSELELRGAGPLVAAKSSAQ